jgi:hypothetical protein
VCPVFHDAVGILGDHGVELERVEDVRLHVPEERLTGGALHDRADEVPAVARVLEA